MLIRCPVCGLDFLASQFQKVFFQRYNQQEYKLFHCKDCDLGFWTPQEVAPEFYRSEAMPLYSAFHEGARRPVSPHHRAFFDFPHPLVGRLLDIGCGDGDFIKKIQDAGVEAYGIDWDERSITKASALGCRNVFSMALDEFAEFSLQHGLMFDSVTFFEVLEHNPDPRHFFSRVKKILKKEGWIAGSVPNAERMWAGFDREDGGDYPPNHFLWMTRNAVKKILGEEGFCEIETYPVTYNTRELFFWLGSHLLNRMSRVFSGLMRAEFLQQKSRKEWTTKFEWTQYILAPAVWLLKPFFNKKGYQIYFKARYLG